MLTVGFGEVLTDILTINPLLSGIQSASAILDTSNFTFNAVSLGKDAHGFKYHAHNLSSVAGGIYNLGLVLPIGYNTTNVSSYVVSSTHQYFSSVYSSIPNAPSFYDRRLERGSTLTNITSTSDVGHYLNTAIDPTFSSMWNVIGGYPPSGTTKVVALYRSATSAFSISATLSGAFNGNALMDKNGFIKVNDRAANLASGDPLFLGPKIYIGDNLSSINLLTVIQMGDAAALASFGGVNHIGVWALDIKDMLASGLNPPYIWNHVNNNRKYKLVAKVTTWENMLQHKDFPAPPLAGIKTFLAEGTNSLGTFGPGITLRFRFT